MQRTADELIAARFDTVIYDLDGTLIDSARDMCVAVSRVLADHGLPAISDEDARLLWARAAKSPCAGLSPRTAARSTMPRRAPSRASRALLRGRFRCATPGFRRRGRGRRPSRPAGPEAGRLHQQVRKPCTHILRDLRLMPPIADVAGADTFTVRKPDPGTSCS